MKKLKIFNSSKLNASDMILMVVLIVSAAVLFVMSMSSYSDTYDTSISYTKDTLSEKTVQCANEIEAQFNEKFALLEYIATLPEINEMKWANQYKYIKGKEATLGFEHLFIMDMTGHGYYVRENTIQDQSGEQFFQDVMNNDKFITEPFMDYNNNKSITTLCVSIYKGGKKVGVLCGAMDLSKVYDLVENMQTGEDGLAAVINEAGEYVASSDMTQVHRKLNIITYYQDSSKHDISFINDNLNTLEDVTGEITIDGVNYYAGITNIENCSWKLILTVSKADSIGQMDNILYTQIAAVIILVVIILVTVRFIAKLMKKERMAFIDSLTGISNRARCTIIMEKLETHKKDSVMIVSFDLNDFKQINDDYGHKQGDNALKTFAKILNKTFGKTGFIGRMGGDEFIAILLNTTQEEYEKLIADMKNLINSENSNRNQKYVISPSYGNAIRPENAPDEFTIHKLYEEADKKMYVYKDVYKSMKKENA
ncbi:MAG: sensor domain-containing diguanylate cyclase [Lachnospiraceae bacterium]|nr:sensor domain-containing diguanylate cyclase [Lachnospiraceae bacterium]